MKILVTGGGTSEDVDGVRRITNMSTGSLAFEILQAFDGKGHELIYLHGLTAKLPEIASLRSYPCGGTQEVYDTMKELLTKEKIDVVVHAMAISDFTVGYVITKDALAEEVSRAKNKEEILRILNQPKLALERNQKISSSEELILGLKKTVKILPELKKWNPDIFLVSFKLLRDVEKEELLAVARRQLKETNSNLVLANDFKELSMETHRAYLVNEEETVEVIGKRNIAKALVEHIEKELA